jgi:hypothetical protein
MPTADMTCFPVADRPLSGLAYGVRAYPTSARLAHNDPATGIVKVWMRPSFERQAQDWYISSFSRALPHPKVRITGRKTTRTFGALQDDCSSDNSSARSRDGAQSRYGATR